jgi:hypothetical protein
MRLVLATVVALAVGVIVGAGAMTLDQPGTANAAHGNPPKGHAKPKPQQAPAFVPACPRPVYSANGNVAPLFCQIDNPVALTFYERLAPRLFSLGPSATPQQVGTALTAATTIQHATSLEACAAYQLAAWWRQWHFAVDPSQPYCNG